MNKRYISLVVLMLWSLSILCSVTRYTPQKATLYFDDYRFMPYDFLTKHKTLNEPEIAIFEEVVSSIEEIEYIEEKLPIDICEMPLNSWIGVIYHYNGTKETYYNLPMSGVVSIMRNLGYLEDEYPYWIRDDGVKMFGDYVMVAAPLDIYPRGSLVETSLGTGIVCDTGEMVGHWLDIAVDW